jgi:CBS domain-containing membrane protein
MHGLAQLFAWQRWRPEPLALSLGQKIKAGMAALVAISLTGAVTYLTVGAHPWLAASMGAASVILFVLPASPLAQPWSFVGGHLVSALIGVACAQWIPDLTLASGCAVGLSIIAMTVLRCLHPPAGSIALMAVIGGPAIRSLGFGFVLMPVLFNSLLMLACALLLNNLWLKHPYPRPLATPLKRRDAANSDPLQRLGVTDEDVAAALTDYQELLDVSRDDLIRVISLAELHAHRRRLGDWRCGDIMSDHVMSVRPDTSLSDAWQRLRRHQLRVLPVVDGERRVLGMLSMADFFRRVDGSPPQLRTRLAQLLQRRGAASTVRSLMSHSVQAVRDTMPVNELVPLLTMQGRHFLPVVDAEERLVGMVSQSDLIGALYQSQLA